MCMVLIACMNIQYINMVNHLIEINEWMIHVSENYTYVQSKQLCVIMNCEHFKQKN